MIATRYMVITPSGNFEAQWDDDELAPVRYEGSRKGQLYLEDFLAFTMATGRRGQRLNAKTLEPDDLLSFCQSAEYGIRVLPEPQEMAGLLFDQPLSVPGPSAGFEVASTLQQLRRIVGGELDDDAVPELLLMAHDQYPHNDQVQLLVGQAAAVFQSHLARLVTEQIR